MIIVIDKTDVPIYAALVTAVVTIVGWFITKALERQQKRVEFRRSYIQRQIEEFYGPLYSLVWQIFSSNSLQHLIVTQCALNSEEREKVRNYFFEMHFLPLHTRIREILETKLYLVDGTEMPLSIYEYLTHSQQEDIQRQLWTIHRVSTIAVPGKPFPPKFFPMIESTLKKLMREYEISVEQLKSGYSASDRAMAKEADAERKLMQRVAEDAR